MRSLPLAALLLVACSSLPDPVDRPGTWQPSGTNEANLRAMVAEPAHLSRGVGAQDSRGEASARPIARLLAGERPGLPDPRTGLRSAVVGTGHAAR